MPKDKIHIFARWLGVLLFGFFTIFFVVYIGKFGVSDLILEPKNKYKTIFNIGVWYVLWSYCFDKVFNLLEDKNAKR